MPIFEIYRYIPKLISFTLYIIKLETVAEAFQWILNFYNVIIYIIYIFIFNGLVIFTFIKKILIK